uniref:F-box only protein 22 n=1 Tax=Lygus hesperus TaxID=30085 RepID=A0A0A9X006_LYGHE
MEYGHYITQEYSILKNIFSYLTAKELKVCSRVCREWKKMADKFVQHTVECYHKPNDAESWQDFNKLINPSLIFYLEIVKYGGRVDALRGLVSKTYDIEDVPFYRMITAHPIFTPCVGGKIILNPEAVDMEKGQTLIFFPQIPGLTIKKFEFDKKFAVKPDQVEPLLSAKGVILLAETSSPCVTASNRIVHYLYFTGSKKKEVRAERPCLAGGLLAKTCRVDNEGKTIPSPVVAFTFEGDNVTIHSDINRTSEFETFFKRLSENAGQKPNGAERFAFIFNCIGRFEYEDDELKLFRKYFPDVPYFGFWSYGEFCIPDSHARNMTDPKKIKIDRHIRYLNSACASYMIVTITH